MSYGAFVQACIDERRSRESLRFFDQLADYPEHHVTAALDALGRPGRRVGLGEVYAEVRRRVSPGERRAWLAQLEAEELRELVRGAGMSERPDLALSVPAELVGAIAERVVELLEERAALAAQEPEPWIGIEGAAAYIGKKRNRLYDLAAQNAIPHGRDGRSVLFRRSDLWESAGSTPVPVRLGQRATARTRTLTGFDLFPAWSVAKSFTDSHANRTGHSLIRSSSSRDTTKTSSVRQFSSSVKQSRSCGLDVRST